MADLSPQAQAVLDAYIAGLASRRRLAIAAALRAAAEEVATFTGRYTMNEYVEGFRDGTQRVHRQLNAIAAELENNNG